MPSRAEHTRLFREEAHAAGFSFCGFAEATELTDESRKLERWLHDGMHGCMTWLENHFGKRIDPRKLEPGTRSVVVLMQNYFPELRGTGSDQLRIAKYALGDDYHKVLKEKMKVMIRNLREKIGDFRARTFVDAGPVMEKAWARRAGLGWQGKNGLLIRPGAGSFFFLGVILSDLVFEYDNVIETDHCGSCSICMDACPTKAIVAPRVIDTRRCISCLTIELKDDIPPEFRSRMQGWIYGCDICQDVCPYNLKFSKMSDDPAFSGRIAISGMSTAEWLEMEESTFRHIFGNSPVTRAGYGRLRRNIRFVTGKDV